MGTDQKMGLPRPVLSLLILACVIICLIALVYKPTGKAKPVLRFDGDTNGTWTFTLTNGTRDVFRIWEMDHLSIRPASAFFWPHSSCGMRPSSVAWSSNLTVGFWCVPAENQFLTRLKIGVASSLIDKWLPWHFQLRKLAFQPMENGFAIWSDTSSGGHNPMIVGSNAPNLQLLRLPGSTAEHLSDYAGKVVVLQFWTTWSPRSQKAVTALQKLARKHPEWKGQVSVLSVNIDGAPDLASQQVLSNHWDNLHNVWLGTKGIKTCRVSHLPTTYVIDRKGKLAAVGELAAAPAIVERLVHAKQ